MHTDDIKLTQEEIEELERQIVQLHNEEKTDIYAIRSKWDPVNYARSQAKQKIPASIRWAVWRRDEFTCSYCWSKDCQLTLDHVIPEEQGGACDETNLIACCPKCNNKKGNKSLQEFLQLPWLTAKQNQNSRHLSDTEKTSRKNKLYAMLWDQRSVPTGTSS